MVASLSGSLRLSSSFFVSFSILQPESKRGELVRRRESSDARTERFEQLIHFCNRHAEISSQGRCISRPIVHSQAQGEHVR